MKKHYENSFYQKLNTFADWVIRITVINILMIICAIPVVTLYPALLAGYKMYHNYLDNKEVPLFKGFFKYFTEDFGKKMQLGLVLAAAILLAVVNMTIYSDYLAINSNPINYVGQYIMIIMVVTIVFVTIYTFPLMITYPKTNLWLLIKFAFFLSGKFILRTMLAILIMAIPLLLLLTPITIVVFVFAGAAIPVLLYALLFKKVVLYVESLDKENV